MLMLLLAVMVMIVALVILLSMSPTTVCARRACCRFERKTTEIVLRSAKEQGPKVHPPCRVPGGPLRREKEKKNRYLHLLWWRGIASSASRPANMQQRRLNVKREAKTVNCRQMSRCVLKQATETLIIRMHAHTLPEDGRDVCAGVAPQALQGRVIFRHMFCAPTTTKTNRSGFHRWSVRANKVGRTEKWSAWAAIVGIARPHSQNPCELYLYFLRNVLVALLLRTSQQVVAGYSM